MMTWCVITILVVAVTAGGVTQAASMEDTVKDLYEAPPVGEQGRLFLNYDQAAAFNTSVAFTIPLFSFTLPGASDTSAAGLDAQSFGAVAFIALFLLGGLAVAIYTTSQGAVGGGRHYADEKAHEESLLTRLVTDSLSGLPNVVDIGSCARLAVCGAHAEPQRYGLFALPIRFLMPSIPDVAEAELTDYQRAARYGDEGERDCQYEFPCLVQPLDLLLYMYEYWFGDDYV
ncbi:uncharacterized protein LOC123504136 [Portunus trituberculatus]|uniref:uncharacterized protein LOC123504136 n=1 Tax=Portunus trituberculatus TaxID=210409 RepID=UPI001E1CDE92|nr:uncharacterized protein LOC123504136 [Portunus trituberculatus]XP_045110394.1 uncharacterized protein LOC123504136 [Portunus trituberculatus]XP_045110395.1 uncharacterized protein LOC123504136 [Portunus trituberculatus]XP_045110396.1 uncharacterized protein LOC123504136 [Portunus trituberculatus]XP_045110397.1 uncharacterized protein LOC123504136 [Portunus trituberculatus]